MNGRDFLKSNWQLLEGFDSDQSRGVEHPPLQKPVPEGSIVVPLPDSSHHSHAPLSDVIESRRSIRKFTDEPLSLEELSWLLWSTQGVQKVFREGVATLRTVPSGGARHPFETYLIVNNVTGLESGVYVYLPVDHSLLLTGKRITPDSVMEGCLGQTFAGECAVAFVWTVVPYRTEWRYGPVSHKVIALDAGHMCQNLYLACTSCGLGTCAIGAYDQEKMDRLLGLEDDDEFVVYISPVGRRD